MAYGLVSPSSCPGAAYYVDPDYGGGGADGSASTPWRTLGSTAWQTINSTLATEDVTVYVSALEPDGVTQEARTMFLEIRRSSTSTHRLTLDGHASYNTDDASPSWANNPAPIEEAYTNGAVFRLIGNGSSALGWSRSSAYPKQDNVTVRGFECTGNGARTSFAGDHTVIEYLHLHDITRIGPALAVLYTFPDAGCDDLSDRILDPCTDLTIRHVRIDTCYGEALYIGSVNPDCPVSIQQAMGNEHSDFLIEDVFIRNPGTGGGQGDGLDIKNGVTKVHIRDCEISGVTGMGAIILPQTMVESDQQILVERCFIHDSAPAGEARRAIYGVSSSGKFGYKGVTVRNCIVARHYQGITLTGEGSNLEKCYVYNNTIYGCDHPGLRVSAVVGGEVFNNLVFDNGGPTSLSGQNIVSDHNAYHGRWLYQQEGVNSIQMSDAERSDVLVSPAQDQYVPTQDSVVIDSGLTVGGFSDDHFAALRASDAWDIGAVEAGGRPSLAPAPPVNLRVEPSN